MRSHLLIGDTPHDVRAHLAQRRYLPRGHVWVLGRHAPVAGPVVSGNEPIQRHGHLQNNLSHRLPFLCCLLLIKTFGTAETHRPARAREWDQLGGDRRGLRVFSSGCSATAWVNAEDREERWWRV